MVDPIIRASDWSAHFSIFFTMWPYSAAVLSLAAFLSALLLFFISHPDVNSSGNTMMSAPAFLHCFVILPKCLRFADTFPHFMDVCTSAAFTCSVSVFSSFLMTDVLSRLSRECFPGQCFCFSRLCPYAGADNAASMVMRVM